MATTASRSANSSAIGPDTIIVAVDFGMTGTAVAFARVQDAELDVVKKWPGKLLVVHKVPTALVYRGIDTRVKHWGCECPSLENLDIGMARLDRFKLFLNEAYYNDIFSGFEDSQPGTYEDICRCFVDFLKLVYANSRTEIIKKLRISDWERSTIHFLFSIPTIWEGTPVVNQYMKLLRKAGFGEGEYHHLELRLTEAEAAAVYTALNARDMYQDIVEKKIPDPENVSPVLKELGREPRINKGDIVLVVDAGGGTTDMAVVKVTDVTALETGAAHDENILHTLCVRNNTVSIAVGSVQIDEAFEDLVTRRLAEVPHDLIRPRELKAMPGIICRDKFQGHKHTFGKPQIVGDYMYRIRELDGNFNHDAARIRNGCLDGSEVAAMFDKQIERICACIKEELRHPERITHIMLAGGLGSSHYLQSKILTRFKRHVDQILISSHPQLAVCKGLVVDKLHRMKHALAIIPKFDSPLSFGVVGLQDAVVSAGIRRRFHRFTHPTDQATQKNQDIDWIIKKGDEILRNQPERYPFTRVITAEEMAQPPTHSVSWRNDVASSLSPRTRLPPSLEHGDAMKQKTLYSKISVGNIRKFGIKVEGARHGFSWTPEHWKLELELRTQLGVDGIHFEVWCGDLRIGRTGRIYTSLSLPSEVHTVAVPGPTRTGRNE